MMTLLFTEYVYAVNTKSRHKIYKKAKSSRGGTYVSSETELYKGESPVKAGTDIVHGINSKFFGFYDHKKSREQQSSETEQ
jgi:hypothetical protein